MKEGVWGEAEDGRFQVALGSLLASSSAAAFEKVMQDQVVPDTI